MGNFFGSIYLFFKERRVLLYSIMVLCFALLGFFSTQIKLNEDLLSFIPNANNKNTSLIFSNIGSNDKIFIMFTDHNEEPDPDSLIDVANSFCTKLKESKANNIIKSITTTIDQNDIYAVTDFIFDNLPIFLTDEDYTRLEERVTPEGIERSMEECYNRIISPQGFALRGIIEKDPLGIANNILLESSKFATGTSYTTYSDYIFSEDLSTLLITLSSKYGISETSANKPLIEQIDELSKEYNALYFGGPTISVFNAECIKSDTTLTLTIAALIIAIVITIAFKNRFALILIGLPVIFGGIFSLSIIYFIKGSISTIAIGTGTAVFGIAMSYAIHVIAHKNHTNSPYQIIKELAYPLTVGSITTIGAFLGLLLTESTLLQDFGLFAALTLVGTTLFSLLFLPHMLQTSNKKESQLLTVIDRITGFNYHKNKWITCSIFIVAIISLFWYNKVEFNSNMADLSITPPHIKEGEKMLSKLFHTTKSTILITNHSNPDSAAHINNSLSAKLEEMKEKGMIESYTPFNKFLISQQGQIEKIERWNKFWEKHNKAQIINNIKKEASKIGFTPQAFNSSYEILNREYTPINLTSDQVRNMPLLKESLTINEASGTIIINRVALDSCNKARVYKELENEENIIIADRGFYTNNMAESIKNDFNTALFISSLLIFVALLISYGRIELALLAFTPMAIAWVIILGIMAMVGSEFNIINIILSTFIFGIGDDFSIFIMDGLLKEHKTGEKLLPVHKTAIFFSAFTTIVGVGSLIFASHPSLNSIATISIIGMSAVVLVSFTIQPIIFEYLIRRPSLKGNFPYTLCGVLNTIYAFTYFLLICIVMQILILVLLIIPYNKAKKKRFFHKAISRVCNIFLHTMFTVKVKNYNEPGESFYKPAIIIANHQSFIDILQILALCDKCIMVTNGWVWHSPFFGWIIRYAGFYHVNDGYEELAKAIAPAVAQGYSVAIFPEGTRSINNKIHKFRKGAFYLAQIMQLDIVPIVLYGNGHISSKSQPFYIKKGYIASEILPRIAPGSAPYKEVAKRCNELFVAEYEKLYSKMASVGDKHFYNSIVMNYLYCSPIIEWYVKIKVKMEHSYSRLHNLLPKNGKIVDIGCGYGMSTFMLSLLSPARDLTGIDYDQEKIDTANNSLLMRYPGGELKSNIEFIYANVVDYDIPQADAYIMSDMLHYLSEEEQKSLIEKCISKLNKGGKIIIRDADTNKKEQQKITALSEFFSTKLIKFNKKESELHFTNINFIETIASRNGMKVESFANDKVTSNTFHILTNAL